MNNESKKIESFEDLNAWKYGHKLVILIYKITSKFPQNEMFGLSSQLRRAGVSITSNIAEGFSRYSKLDKRRFYINSIGSLTEIQSQLIIAKELNYIDLKTFDEIKELATVVSKLINGLIKGVKDHP